MSKNSDFCDMCSDRLSDVCNECVGSCTTSAMKVERAHVVRWLRLQAQKLSILRSMSAKYESDALAKAATRIENEEHLRLNHPKDT